MSESPYLSPTEAAKYLRCSSSTLAKLRVYGGGPPFCKLGSKAVRYRQSDLDSYMSKNRLSSTAQFATLANSTAEPTSPAPPNQKNGRR